MTAARLAARAARRKKRGREHVQATRRVEIPRLGRVERRGVRGEDAVSVRVVPRQA